MPAVDHFKCYKAVGTGGFARHLVTLVDQFGTSLSVVIKPDTLCNAVDKNGEGIGDPTAHLECYVISQAGGAPRRPAVISNQFGSETSLVGSPRRLCVPAERNGVASSLNLDHFKFYRAGRAMPTLLRRAVTHVDDYELNAPCVLTTDLLFE